MADTQVVKIFEINVQPVVEQLSALGAQLDSAKKKYIELKETQGQYAEDTIRAKANTEALSKEYKSIETVLNNNTKALYALDKTAQDSLKTRKFEANSIDTNRKLYNSLYNEIIKQKKPTEDQIALAKKLSDTLKQQEQALGDTRRNVGNYAEGFKSAFGAISNAIPQLKGFQSAQQGVNMALSANPIGAVVLLLNSLKEIFGENAVVADQLSFIFAGINKVFKLIIDTTVDLFTHFDKLAEVIANPIGSMVKFGQSLATAAEEGYKSAQMLDDLNDQLGLNSAAIAKNNVAISQNQTILKNKTKDDAERVKAAKEIIRLENDNTDRRVDNAKKELEAEALKLKSLKGSSEQRKIVYEKIAALDQARADGIDAVRKAEIENDKILNEGKDEARKKAEEIAKKAAEDRKKYLENLKKLEEEFNLTERQKLIASFDDKIATITGKSEEEINLRKAIEQKKQDALLKFDFDSGEKLIENERKLRAAELALEQDSLDKRLKLADLAFESEEKAMRDAGSSEELILKARNKKVLDITTAFNLEKNSKEFTDKIAQNKRTLDLDLEAVDLSIGTEQEKADKKKAIQLKALEEQLAITREFVGKDGKVTQDELDGIKKVENAIAKLNQVATETPQQQYFSALGIDKDQMNDAENSLKGLAQIVTGIQNIVTMGYEQRLTEIDSQKEYEIAAINESALSKEDKVIKIKEIEKQAAQEKYEIEKEQFETNKAVQIVQAIIGTALGVINGLNAGFSLGPAGVAMGPILAALAAATGVAQIAIIAASKPPAPPKFKDGVIGLDGAGSSTSDSIDAKLSRGESVMTARATDKYAPILAQMEMSVGNRPNFQLGNKRFATGFIPQTDGGYFARSTANQVVQNSDIINGFKTAVNDLPSPVLQYSEFTTFQKGVNKSTAISEL
jgi:hypothetical protein